MTFKNRLTFATICISLISLTSLAQNNTASPYSMYGIGNIEYKGDVINMGMGHTGLALPATNYINTVNPASLSKLDSLTMLFNIQAKGTFSTFETSSEQQTNFNTNINGISMAFKVNPRWGMGISLSPYSNVGYKIQSEKYLIGTTSTYPVTYSGEGGVIELAWSNGIEVFRNFSLGLKGSLLWGNIDVIETSEYPAITGQTIYNEHSYHVNNFNLEYGFQYFIPIHKYKLSFGANFSNETSLTTWFKQRVYTDGDAEYYSDKTNVDNLFLPTTYGAGIALQHDENWLFAFDYHAGNWSNINLINTTSKTRDTQQFNGGIQWSPQKNRYRSVFNRMQYRIGAFYADKYLSIKDVELHEKGITAGFTIPLKNASLLNVGYEYKEGGSLKNGLVKENFHSVKLGLTFNESWFRKSVFK
nr:hypothetical protein [uncultured Carboxylicivirga sp.]